MKTKMMIDRVIPFEEMEFRLLKTLSYYLEMDFTELMEIQPDLHPVKSKSGEPVAYRLFFKHDAPIEVLKKIKGITMTNEVNIEIHVINGIIDFSRFKTLS